MRISPVSPSMCAIAIAFAVVGLIGKGLAMAVPAQPIALYYVNWSPFHGDGEVVWLGDDGSAVVQKALRDRVQLYRWKLDEPRKQEVLAALGRLPGERMKVVDRLGIPDEVRVRIGFRRAKSELRGFTLWDRDWAKQSADVRKLREIVQIVLAELPKQKPVSDIQNKPGAMTLERPAEFVAADIDTALK